MEKPGPSELNFDFSKEEDQKKFGEINEEYPEAIREFVDHAESEAWEENIFRYAEEHYKDYAIYDEESAEIINIIAANRARFKNETLPNISDELIDRALNFIAGNQDEQIATLLKRANFDYEGLLASKEEDQKKFASFWRQC